MSVVSKYTQKEEIKLGGNGEGYEMKRKKTHIHRICGS